MLVHSGKTLSPPISREARHAHDEDFVFVGVADAQHRVAGVRLARPLARARHRHHPRLPLAIERVEQREAIVRVAGSGRDRAIGEADLGRLAVVEEIRQECRRIAELIVKGRDVVAISIVRRRVT